MRYAAARAQQRGRVQATRKRASRHVQSVHEQARKQARRNALV
jgi:hypothetical protein